MSTIAAHNLKEASSPYSVPGCPGPLDLFLDANEGATGCVDIESLVASLGPETIRRYPKAATLEQAIARRWNVDPARVVVTAGADEAIDRVCRAVLGPGRNIALAVPTFEMIARYARLAGALVVEVPWMEGPYPAGAVIDAAGPETGLVAVVSPNNPTGGVATGDDVAQLAEGVPHATVLVDLAYAEFADEDLTAAALALPNAVVVRTFSKAFGLAGARVGYAIAPLDLAKRLRGCGSPYPVAGLSIAAATAALERAAGWLPDVVSRVRGERERLVALLAELGARPLPSQGNFVLAEFADAEWAWRGLGGLGISVRRFAGGSALERYLRISCPADDVAFERLARGLRAVLRPRGLLLDMDGVMADVSGSYRRAIAGTAAMYGVELSTEDLRVAKREPGSNNDWVVTRRLLASHGVEVSLDEVTSRFQALYLGDAGRLGFEADEKLIPSRATLERLALRLPLGIVTGRPRRECERFLERFGLAGLFAASVCMEDGPSKPDPAGVRLALARMGVEDAWMVGDTPDDVVAARLAGVVPLGVCPPGEDGAGLELRGVLERAGAARVLGSLAELKEMLP